MFGIRTRSDAGQVQPLGAKLALRKVREASAKEWYDGTMESLVERQSELTQLTKTVQSALASTDPLKGDEIRDHASLKQAESQIKSAIKELDDSLAEIRYFQSRSASQLSDVSEIRPFSERSQLKDAGLHKTRKTDVYEKKANVDQQYFVEVTSRHFGEDNVELYGDPGYFREAAEDFAINETQGIETGLRSQMVSAFVRRASYAASKEFSQYSQMGE